MVIPNKVKIVEYKPYKFRVNGNIVRGVDVQ